MKKFATIGTQTEDNEVRLPKTRSLEQVISVGDSIKNTAHNLANSNFQKLVVELA